MWAPPFPPGRPLSFPRCSHSARSLSPSSHGCIGKAGQSRRGRRLAVAGDVRALALDRSDRPRLDEHVAAHDAALLGRLWSGRLHCRAQHPVARHRHRIAGVHAARVLLHRTDLARYSGPRGAGATTGGSVRCAPGIRGGRTPGGTTSRRCVGNGVSCADSGSPTRPTSSPPAPIR